MRKTMKINTRRRKAACGAAFFIKRTIGLSRECTDKGTALIVQCPGGIEIAAAVLVGHGDSGHGMCCLGERRVESVFVSAEMVFVANGAGFNRDDIAGL